LGSRVQCSAANVVRMVDGGTELLQEAHHHILVPMQSSREQCSEIVISVVDIAEKLRH
jgi:hypothetical protein